MIMLVLYFIIIKNNKLDVIKFALLNISCQIIIIYKQCCAVHGSNRLLLEHCNKFQLELECSKCVPMKSTYEIQIQCHTYKFHWLILFEELYWNISIVFQCSNVPIAQHCIQVTQ